MIVLDSHIWYWWINLEHERLSTNIISVIENEARVGVSAVSCFELALAHHRNRLELPLPPRDWFELALKGSDIELLTLTSEISIRAVELTAIHRDPFDRIIISTALELDAQLVSSDTRFTEYPELADRLLK